EIGSNRLVDSQDDGHYDIFLKRNDVIVCKISIEDQIRPEAAELIRVLKEMDIEPVLLSGDKQAKCVWVASQLGITTVHAEKLPQEKLELIDLYRTRGTTAMVGDGINDAPALTTADVGISLGNASQVAIQSAKVILLNNDLKSVTTL